MTNQFAREGFEMTNDTDTNTNKEPEERADDEPVHVSVEAEVVSSDDEPADDGERADGVEADGADEGEPEREYPRRSPRRPAQALGAGNAPDGRRHDITPELRQWAMFCHLGGLAGFVVPFGGIIAPLILWQMKREESPFIDEQGREALNFNITIVGATYLLTLVAVFTMFFFFGFLLIPVVFGLTIAHVVFAIIAALKANEGIAYRYPFTLRLVT